MKTKLLITAIALFTICSYSQQYNIGTIITKHYDTIVDVKIEKLSDSKSLTHLVYVDKEGNTQSPDINTIKCYTRGDDKYVRVYYDCEMILVRVVELGNKLNLYERNLNGVTSYFIEKVYDELIKVPSSSGKFSKVVSAFLSTNEELSSNIKTKKLTDIKEIVDLYNKG